MSESSVPPRNGDELGPLEARIVALRVESQRAYEAFARADAALREAMAERLRLARSTAPPVPRATRTARPATTAGAAVPAPGPETSTRTVQNVLFVLGGVLLGTAAIAFTVVAWTTYGVVARAATLATVTLLALAVPAVALGRRLRATAETFAAIGLLLVALDGYAAWYVNLGGVRSWDSGQYAGFVAAVTAVVAFGYGRLTGLAGPAFVALVAAQPVALLVTAPARPGLAVTSLLASAVAAGDALIIRRLRARAWPAWLTNGVVTGLSAVAWTGFALWIGAASVTALLAEATGSTVPDRMIAGAATIAISLVLLLGAWATGLPASWSVAGAAVVAAVVLAVLLTAVVAWPGHPALLFAATTLAVGAIVRSVLTAVPDALRSGLRGAASGIALLGLFCLAYVALAAAGLTVGAANPLRSVPLAATGPHPPLLTWELPVALLGLTAAALLAVPRWTDAPVAVGGGVLTVLALPGCLPLAWWTPPALALGGVVVLAGAHLLLRRRGHGATPIHASTLIGAAVLVGYAVLTSTVRPGLTALVHATIVVLGLTVAALLRISPAAPSLAQVRGGADSAPSLAQVRGEANSEDPPRGDASRPPRDDVVGTAALATGLLAFPPAVGSALRALGAPPWWGLRATVGAATLLLLAVVVLRRRSSTVDGYVAGAVVAVVGSVALWPLVARLVGEEPSGIYSGVSLLLLAGVLAVLSRPPDWTVGAVAAAAVPNGAVLAVAVAPAVLAVSLYPYGWLSAVWERRPSGVGFPAGDPSVRPVDAAAMVILAVAGALAAYSAPAIRHREHRGRQAEAVTIRQRMRSALAGLGIAGPTAVLAAIVAARAPWPALPAATLMVGLALLLPVAIARTGSASIAPPTTARDTWRSTVLGGQGVVYIGAGVAGALPLQWSTLSALGVVIVAFCIVGAAGRTVGWRVVGCGVAVAAAVAEASAAGVAAELQLRTVAFVVLGAGTVALFAGAWVRRRPARRAEALVTEAAATGAAVVALTFTAGDRGSAAGVCAVWGLALAVRALVPGITRGVRSGYASVGGGLEVVAWWLLLAERAVSVVEAYTLPLAAVALFAGWTALRARPELRSWVAYGPALLAGFLPTLATVVVTDGEVARRLALGVAALLCVVLGSVRRRQAPVVVGGIVLVIVALHELALLWQRVQGWVPLALGGAALLFLAITYERRRRDVARVRSALHRMT